MIIKKVCNKGEKREKMKKRDTKNTNTWNWGERGWEDGQGKKEVRRKMGKIDLRIMPWGAEYKRKGNRKRYWMMFLGAEKMEGIPMLYTAIVCVRSSSTC